VNVFIDEHRARSGVEPICSALKIAPSAYRQYAARQRDPALLSARARRDASLLPQVQCVYDQNLRVYGADKVWRLPGARRRDRGALHRRAADAPARVAGRAPRQEGAHHRARCQGGVSAGPGEPAVQRRSAEPTVGGGLHLRQANYWRQRAKASTTTKPAQSAALQEG